MHLKVLIVEDCEDDATQLAHYLKSCSFAPSWERVNSESRLSELLEDRSWDLILCDINMPQLPPFTTVDCVRKIDPYIPILLLTDSISSDKAIELLQYGVQDVVLKNDMPRLKSVIMKELTLARHREEKAAAESRFGAALESLDQGVALYDSKARLITCNRKYISSLNLCEDIIIAGLHYGDLIQAALERGQFARGTDSAGTFDKRLFAYNQPTGRYPIEVKHHDGRWVEIQRLCTDEGGFVTVATDITESKKREEALMKQAAELARINHDLFQEIQRREETEAALKESESRARAIFESAIDGVITFNEDLRIEGVNPAAERIFGYTAKELMSLHIHHLMFKGESSKHRTNDDQPAQTNLISIRDKGVHTVNGWRKNGQLFPVDLTVSTVHLDKRTIYTGIIRDVTERTKLDKMKSEFVSVVSHELRTPLTSIRGSLALLNTKAVGELPPRAQAMISIGLQNSDRLVALINDILDIEKIEAGMMNFDFQLLSLETLFNNAIRSNMTFLEQMNVSTEIIIEGADDFFILGDQDRMMQVLTNLISNAAKFSPPGTTITLGGKLNNGDVRIWVTDRGEGIPKAFQDQIFQKFSQADASDTRQIGGTGLGLSIVKAIVEHHCGKINFETEEGKGTTFYFELPKHDEVTIRELKRRSA